jgi:hypothetical protein
MMDRYESSPLIDPARVVELPACDRHQTLYFGLFCLHFQSSVERAISSMFSLPSGVIICLVIQDHLKPGVGRLRLPE